MDRRWVRSWLSLTVWGGFGDHRGLRVTDTWERPPPSFFATAGGKAVGTFAVLILLSVIVVEAITAYQLTVNLKPESEPSISSGGVRNDAVVAVGTPAGNPSREPCNGSGCPQGQSRQGQQCDLLFQTVIAADAKSISASIDAFKAFCDLSDDQRLSLTSRLANLQSAASPAGPLPSVSAKGGPVAESGKVASGDIVPPAPRAVASNFRSYRNTDMYGGDLAIVRDVDLAACQDACRADGRCVAYSYDQWNKACYTKSEIKELVIDVRSVTAVSSAASAPAASRQPTVFETFHNAAFPDQEAEKRSAQSFEDCEGSCSRSGTCVAVTYSKKSHTCQMFEAAQKYVAQPGSESAAKSQTN